MGEAPGAECEADRAHDAERLAAGGDAEALQEQADAKQYGCETQAVCLRSQRNLGGEPGGGGGAGPRR